MKSTQQVDILLNQCIFLHMEQIMQFSFPWLLHNTHLPACHWLPEESYLIFGMSSSTPGCDSERSLCSSSLAPHGMSMRSVSQSALGAQMHLNCLQTQANIMKFLFFICSVLWLLILNGMTTTPEVKKMQLPNSR